MSMSSCQPEAALIWKYLQKNYSQLSPITIIAYANFEKGARSVGRHDSVQDIPALANAERGRRVAARRTRPQEPAKVERQVWVEIDVF